MVDAQIINEKTWLLFYSAKLSWPKWKSQAPTCSSHCPGRVQTGRKWASSWKWPKGIEPMWYQTWERAQVGNTINSILLPYFYHSTYSTVHNQLTAFVYVWYRNPPNWMSDPQDSVEKLLNQESRPSSHPDPKILSSLGQDFSLGESQFHLLWNDWRLSLQLLFALIV